MVSCSKILFEMKKKVYRFKTETITTSYGYLLGKYTSAWDIMEFDSKPPGIYKKNLHWRQFYFNNCVPVGTSFFFFCWYKFGDLWNEFAERWFPFFLECFSRIIVSLILNICYILLFPFSWNIFCCVFQVSQREIMCFLSDPFKQRKLLLISCYLSR